MNTDKPCETCRYASTEFVLLSRQLRCGNRKARWTFASVQFERSDDGYCGPEGRLWEVRETL